MSSGPHVYQGAVGMIWTKKIDLSADSLKYGLLTGFGTKSTTSYGHGDASGSGNWGTEATGTGYTAGGNTLASPAVNTATANQIAFTATSPTTWSTVSVSTVLGGFVWDDTPTTPKADPVICQHDFGGSGYTVVAGTFNVAFNDAASGGLFYGTV